MEFVVTLNQYGMILQIFCLVQIAMGCAAAKSGVPTTPRVQLTEAQRIVAIWSMAQGSDRVAELAEVRAQLDGKWNPLATAFDPILTDPQFRIHSDERYQVDAPVTEQNYRGPGGNKRVLRDSSSVRVWYNGTETQDRDVKAAAALAADCYRMFVLGPVFFQERSARFELKGKENVDGVECDELSAHIRPGLGFAADDTIELAIDRTNHRLVRIRMSPSGWERTRGKTAEIFLREPTTLGGITFPTVFHEQMQAFLPVAVHDWTLSGFRLK